MLALRELKKEIAVNRNGKSKICEFVRDGTVFEGAFDIPSKSTQGLNKFSKISVTVFLIK